MPGTVVEAMLAADAVSEAKLKVSNAPSDGDYLRHKDSATGMEWRAPRLTLSQVNRTTLSYPPQRGSRPQDVLNAGARRNARIALPLSDVSAHIAFVVVRSYSDLPRRCESG